MKVHADIEGLAYAAMQAVMLHEAQEHGLSVLVQSAERLKIGTEYGAFGILNQGLGGLRLEVEAENESDVHVLRDSLVEHIAQILPDLATTITWSDSIAVGHHPPNFQFATVNSVQPLCSEFTRVTLTLPNPEGFGPDAIHFRFVLTGTEDHAPQWPVLGANGRTIWPTGEKALHKPVYTVRAQRADQIDVDIFAHKGGLAHAWAQSVQAETRVAVMGPGGGGILQHSKVVLAGDETAFPAMARILDGLPLNATGALIASSGSGARDYPFPVRAGMGMEWVQPQDFPARVACAAEQAHEDAFLWIAAGHDSTTTLRKDPKIAAKQKTRKNVATYWF